MFARNSTPFMTLPFLLAASFSFSLYGNQINHDTYNTIVKNAVHGGLVDYPLIKNKYKFDLQTYLYEMSEINVSKYSRQEQIAYYINVYNGTVILAVANRYHPKYSVSEKNYGIFKEKIVRLKGKNISLDELEKGIMLPTFKDGRLHVALVCGAFSCPPLLNRAYVGKTLDRDLDMQMKAFLHDSKRNEIDVRSESLNLSKIFEWYAGDFKPGVVQYLNKYTKHDISDFDIRYMRYDWSINIYKK